MTEATLPMRLRIYDRPALGAHFLALDGEDRRLRFGTQIADDGLRAYVQRIDFDRDGIFAVANDDLELVAVVHVAFGDKSAELGLSVLPAVRGKGLGNALLKRAVMHLRNRGALEVFVHCLSENGAMMHLARKNGMRILAEGPETDARLVVERPTTHSHFTEWLHDNQASALQALRKNAFLSRGLLGIFRTS
jgi:RimJ/RimL family protein N-acetyltransferase